MPWIESTKMGEKLRFVSRFFWMVRKFLGYVRNLAYPGSLVTRSSIGIKGLFRGLQ
jgi:hypothetical protein